MEMLQPRYISEEEYDEMEEISNVKHEYFNGEVYAMSGGTNRHAVICTNVAAALHAALKGKPCRVVASEQRVKIEASGLQTYPDASVYCPDARFAGKGDQMLLSPTVLIEVLSPSTETYDRGAKFIHYKRLPSLCDYVLVTQAYILVEHFHRHDAESWLLKTYNELEHKVWLDSIECEISLADLYDGIELSNILPLHFSAREDDEE